MALAVPILGYALPTAYDPTTVVTVGLGVLVAYALLISGIGLLVARSFVALGYLAHRKEYSALAPQLGTCVPAWLATCGFVPWYLLTVTTSGDSSGHDQLPFTAPIVIYTVLPVAASLLITANLVTVFALFFPSQRRLAEYTARPT
ncbi:hypothetical protein [Amycolatopsis sp. NPDC051903]|uniref:hypothetical protein n=1 Tax=Amycolatopsis sp. NPDC051903 TaxID=3363936 RepID=UPI0037AADC2A